MTSYRGDGEEILAVIVEDQPVRDERVHGDLAEDCVEQQPALGGDGNSGAVAFDMAGCGQPVDTLPVDDGGHAEPVRECFGIDPLAEPQAHYQRFVRGF